MINISTLIIPSMLSIQTRREGADEDTDESWSSPDSSDEEEGGPDHVQCMSSWAPHTNIHMHTYIYNYTHLITLEVMHMSNHWDTDEPLTLTHKHKHLCKQTVEAELFGSWFPSDVCDWRLQHFQNHYLFLSSSWNVHRGLVSTSFKTIWRSLLAPCTLLFSS